VIVARNKRERRMVSFILDFGFMFLFLGALEAIYVSRTSFRLLTGVIIWAV
jgi:hypothetical protein